MKKLTGISSCSRCVLYDAMEHYHEKILIICALGATVHAITGTGDSTVYQEKISEPLWLNSKRGTLL